MVSYLISKVQQVYSFLNIYWNLCIYYTLLCYILSTTKNCVYVIVKFSFTYNFIVCLFIYLLYLFFFLKILFYNKKIRYIKIINTFSV